jgi:aryl-alcohol dehydrogenase-like predicted oxidoreductase
MDIRTIQLGNTDIEITPMGVGTWAWGDRLFWSYGKTHTKDDVQAAFETSLEAGINFFDTAEFYGFGGSEKLLGLFAGNSTQEIVTATKFMPFPWRLRRASLLKALRKSLDRLGMSHVDLYQMHWPFPPISIETWMEGMSDAVEAGLARAVGVSNYDSSQMRRAHAALAQRGIPLASNQVEYSLLHRAPERNGLLEVCRELGVTLIAYSPLAQGLLTGKYTPDDRPSGVFRRISPGRLAAIQPLIGKLREIDAAHGGKTPSQVALNWLICKGGVPIPGAKNAHQARENAGALGWRLTDEEVAALDAASAEVG